MRKGEIIALLMALLCFVFIIDSQAQNIRRVEVCEDDFFLKSGKDVKFYMIMGNDTIRGIKDTANAYLFVLPENQISEIIEYVFETDKFIYKSFLERAYHDCDKPKICIIKFGAKKKETYNLEYYCYSGIYVHILHKKEKNPSDSSCCQRRKNKF